MGQLMTLYVNNTLNYLEQQGKRIITQAKRTKDTQNETYNQYDAYGYLVYYNGTLKRWSLSPDLSYGEKHRGSEKYGVPEATGAEWAMMFRDEFQPPKSGFALVVFNAAFYSNIHEDRKWHILSQVVGDIKELKVKFKGSTITPIGNITIE